MFHLNTRSLGKKVSGVVDYCSVIDHDFDIYAFTETWFNADDDSNSIIPIFTENVTVVQVVVLLCSSIQNIISFMGQT